MPNEQCWILNDECSHSHTLTLSHSHSLDSWFIYERWVRKDECRMSNAGCWVPSPTLTLSHSHTHTHLLTHKQKSCWSVPNPNRELFIVTSKKTRFTRRRSPSRQRTVCCYLEKDKTASFPILTEDSALLYLKREDWTVPDPNSELSMIASWTNLWASSTALREDNSLLI